MMKKLITLGLMLLSASVTANATANIELNQQQRYDVEQLLADSGAKSLYLTRECGVAIDANKFKELADIKAMSEGYPSAQGVNWKKIKRNAHAGYKAMQLDAPKGELCTTLTRGNENKYQWVKDIAPETHQAAE
ncbi:hypothetical protein ACFSJY_14985 [Thalassotalea euphylliae]|uniref:hypothetical protein n=1 Tax=Thalassotalea euphylliae TaxID=1655234 RepID=UPI00363A9575